MSVSVPKKGSLFWLAPAFFLLAAAPGFWYPVLTNVLTAQGWSEHITLAFLVPPIAGILSPLIMGARADQSIAAENLLACIVGGGAVFLWIAFETLERGQSPYWFLFWLSINGLVTAPAWSLITTVTLNALDDPSKDFGKYRVWGTLGWMAAGWIVSLLAMDQSPSVGKLSIAARVLGAACCLMLPHTPPQGGPPKNLAETLGLGTLRLLKYRDMAVFFVTAFVFSIPLAAYYLHTPRHLLALGFEQTAAGLTVGQITETVAMLLMGWFLSNWRIKWVLVLAMASGVIRYSLYAFGAIQSSPWLVLLGVAFHGLCWTYFFEAGKVFLDRRAEKGIRAQSQAFLSLLTGGIGGVLGTLSMQWLYSRLVNEATGSGWENYWWVLTAFCAVCLIGFLIGYKGEPSEQQPDST